MRTRDIDLANLPYACRYLIEYYSGKTMPRTELERIARTHRDYERELGMVSLILEETYKKLTNETEKALLKRECMDHMFGRLEQTGDFIKTLNDAIEHLKRMEHDDFVNSNEEDAYLHIYENRIDSKFITLINVTEQLVRKTHSNIVRKSKDSRIGAKMDTGAIALMEQNDMKGLICSWQRCQKLIPVDTLAISKRAVHRRKYFHEECARKLHIIVKKNDLRNIQ